MNKKTLRIAEEILKAAENLIFADDVTYIYDPDHKKHPGGGYHKTEKGWSKVEENKDKPKEQYEIDWDKAKNKNTTPNELDELAKSKHSFVRMDVANNPNTSSQTLALLSDETENMNVLYGVARHNNTTTDILEKLSNHPNNDVRKWVAFNPNTSPKTLEKLSQDKNIDVKLMIARNKNTPEKVLLDYTKSGGGEIMYAIASNTGTSYNIQKRVANYWNPAIRETLAQNRHTDSDILKKLSKDTEKSVRMEVAKNMNTYDSTLVSLTKDSQSLQVRKAAQKTLDKKMNTPVRDFLEDIKMYKNMRKEEKEDYAPEDIEKWKDISLAKSVFEDNIFIDSDYANSEMDYVYGNLENGSAVSQYLKDNNIYENKKFLSKAKELASMLSDKKGVILDSEELVNMFMGVAQSVKSEYASLKTSDKQKTQSNLETAAFLLAGKALKPKYNPYITLKTIGYIPKEIAEPIKFDITKLSPELREKVKDWDAEDIAKFLGWLKKQKEEEI
jgi:hypothetical protein